MATEPCPTDIWVPTAVGQHDVPHPAPERLARQPAAGHLDGAVHGDGRSAVGRGDGEEGPAAERGDARFAGERDEHGGQRHVDGVTPGAGRIRRRPRGGSVRRRDRSVGRWEGRFCACPRLWAGHGVGVCHGVMMAERDAGSVPQVDQPHRAGADLAGHVLDDWTGTASSSVSTLNALPTSVSGRPA